MNYSQITSAIKTRLNRGSSLDSEIPDWIAFAESQINAELNHNKYFQTVTSTLTAGTDSIAYPSALEIMSVSIEYSGVIEPVFLSSGLPPNDADAAYPNACVVEADIIRFNCVADQNYTIYVQCYGQLDIASTTTNWLGDEVPNAYIYGALMHSAVNTKSDPTQYAGFFESAIATAKRLNKKRSGVSQSTLVTDVPSSLNTFNIITG